ncbi:hypothetical protein Tco_0981390 [Tanacetum coccineum]
MPSTPGGIESYFQDNLIGISSLEITLRGHVPSSRKVLLKIKGEPEDRQRTHRPQKSAGKEERSVSRKTSSAMPVGVEIVRSASSSIIRVLVKAGRLSSFQMERGIRLMLAPRSAKAKHSFILEYKRDKKEIYGLSTVSRELFLG